MPLEGHWKRVNTPLRSTTRREARLVAVIVAAGLAVVLGIVLYAAIHGGSSKAGPGCIEITAAHSTGGATLEACGADAARWCRSTTARHDAFARKVQARCRDAGYH